MHLYQFALLAVGAALVAAGLLVIRSRFRSSRRLAHYESGTLRRSSLLNQDRVDRINASRETAAGQWVDRVRIVSFGVWLIVAGAIVIFATLQG